MAIYVVFPTPNLTAMRSRYKSHGIRGRDNPNQDEEIHSVQINAAGDKYMTGTHRAMRSQLEQGQPPWLEIYDTHDDLMASGWVYPPPTV